MGLKDYSFLLMRLRGAAYRGQLCHFNSIQIFVMSDCILFKIFQVFHGGELITGSLKIQLKKEVTINAIRIQFRGRAVYLDPKHPTKEAAEKVHIFLKRKILKAPLKIKN